MFTAFSGSHQDAIKKGLAEWAAEPRKHWDVPYLAIDPNDIAREYREVIRVNSQSGKGGVAYLLESEFGIELPKDLQREFGPLANEQVDQLGREVSATELREMFWRNIDRTTPWNLQHFHADGSGGRFRCRATLERSGTRQDLTGEGTAQSRRLCTRCISRRGEIRSRRLQEHALSSGRGGERLLTSHHPGGWRSKWAPAWIQTSNGVDQSRSQRTQPRELNQFSRPPTVSS